MARKSSKSIIVDPNVRCLRIYPIENTNKRIEDLKTIGLKLSKDQAIHLSRVLLAVAQDWDEIDLTAYRFERRGNDGTYHITVTSMES
jgi:hypothetical protein